MNWRAVVLPALAVVGLAVVACDRDPVRPDVAFALAGCPAAPLNVNAPIPLEFSQPVLPTTIAGGNIVVTNIETGLEIPGTVQLDPTSDGRRVLFTPSDPLPFQTLVRVRIQNLLTPIGSTPIDVTVCEILTEPPPITELWWEVFPSFTGSRLLGASQYAANEGVVASAGGPIFRRDIGDFVVALHSPHWSSALDVSAVSDMRFFSAHIDIRQGRFVIVETQDRGATFAPILSSGFAVTRILFRPLPGTDDVFGVAGGGTALNASFFKWEPGSGSFTQQNIAGTANVQDIAFLPHATSLVTLEHGAAVTAGVVLPSVETFGKLFVTSDSGRTWTEVAGSEATPETRFYRGVALRANGDIYVSGGNAALLRFAPAGGGAYTRTVVPVDPSLVSIDPSDPSALAFNDVQFAPDGDQRGWVVGQQLIGIIAGVPRFQGLIYETRDGGSTWTRQGVVGAEEFGASFPVLNRIDALPGNANWIVGNGGIVLTYSPQP